MTNDTDVTIRLYFWDYLGGDGQRKFLRCYWNTVRAEYFVYELAKAHNYCLVLLNRGDCSRFHVIYG